ncbi:SRPBCC family protein [Sphaerobacter sp.]|uniref:SRPBCC family protein n=1 Tax=Sphaerobacter sp. TaxID=2099654 RepID=UPI001DEFB512|nr:SRPBCC family protein [Sphaerobacter sp.]MBX5444894.1 SRPBCC family protein [Sphaerobacter sp.]
MATVTKSIEVNVPLSTAYNQWTQFEEFPQFMEGVKEVRQIDDQHLHWRAEVGGTEQEWQARIVEQVPDQRIAWHSVAGDENAGVVTFHYIDEDTTRVTLQLGYEPEGLKERIGDALGFMERRVQGDLERFKDFIERRGRETGGWRGTIEEHPHTEPT